jgi:transposase-like protein
MEVYVPKYKLTKKRKKVIIDVLEGRMGFEKAGKLLNVNRDAIPRMCIAQLRMAYHEGNFEPAEVLKHY